MSASASSSGWTEPPWTGWIATTGDALLMLEAARRGVIPRVTRRLVDSERKMIASGSVFVFDEDESGIKRWTDGLFWSPSRILGNFLLYRETDKRGAGHRRAEKQPPQQPQPQQPQQPQQPHDAWDDGADRTDISLSRPKGESTKLGIDRQRERILVGSLTNSYKFKPGGLMKKTFSLTIAGVSQHLISYYKIEDVESGRLGTPMSIPELAALDISPEYLDKTHFRIPPKVEPGADGRLRYVGEADDAGGDVDALLPGSPRALLTDVPIALEPAGSPTLQKRAPKRYEPYDAGAVAAAAGSGGAVKSRRRNKSSISSHPDSTSPAGSPGHDGSPTLSSPEDGGAPFPYLPAPGGAPYYSVYPPGGAYPYPPAYPTGYAGFGEAGAPGGGGSGGGSYYYPPQPAAYPSGFAWGGGAYAGAGAGASASGGGGGSSSGGGGSGGGSGGYPGAHAMPPFPGSAGGLEQGMSHGVPESTPRST